MMSSVVSHLTKQLIIQMFSVGSVPYLRAVSPYLKDAGVCTVATSGEA